MTTSQEPVERPISGWSPWRTVTAFGLVSLSADMVYEGMRSVAGPYLAGLGATALVVGLVTGAGEGLALVLRLVSGPLADRLGRHWTLTTVGYGMTAVCVPLLALAPALGSAGLAFAATLILLERAGKAVRSPSKSALLADVAAQVGRGKGFAVHKALDQVGAFAGPLLLAGLLALGLSTSVSLATLAVPGAAAMVLLAVLRRHVDAPATSATSTAPRAAAVPVLDAPRRLPREFHLFALAVACTTAGLMTFGVLSFHLVDDDLVPTAGVPLVYAGAMLVAAVGALATGWAYDRWGARVLHTLPPLVALVPLLALADTLGVVLVGLAAWALAGGVQDSTVKALVADLVPRGRLATAFGVFAAFQGGAALLGGAGAGALYEHHRMLLVALVGALQAVAAVLLVVVLRRRQGA